MRRLLANVSRTHLVVAGAIALAVAVTAGLLVAAHPAAGAFPGANGKIAFTRDNDMWVMNADGSAQTQLTFNSEGVYEQAAWSPDGTKIAFESRRPGTDNDDDVWVMNADGTDPVNLTDTPSWDGLPAWSPDGTRIAFTSDQDSNYYVGDTDVYVMNADGSGVTRLTDSPGWDGGPAWSPDGSRIVFSSVRNGGSRLFVMKADGSGQTQLTTGPTDSEASWSPDGTRIAFGGYAGSYGIYVIDADGGNRTALVTDPAMDVHPSWAPDGSKIIFSTDRGNSTGYFEIYVMNADGSGQANLTNDPAGIDAYPDWGPLPDRTPPAAAPTQAPPANGAGWNSSDVTVTWHWTDNAGGSGIDGANCTTSSVSSGEGTITLNAACKDLAGNTGNASYTVKVDKTAPTLSFAGGGTYSLLQTVDVACVPGDGLSGIDTAASTCTAPAPAVAWTFGAGAHTVTGTAFDKAGNSLSGSTSFTVAVASSGLCTLTKQFVQGSAKYQGLNPFGKAVVNAFTTTACQFLTAIGPKLSPSHKAAFISAYKSYVSGLVPAGWLTPDQAATLRNLADAL